jgi:HlyD family secretion protein
MDRNLSVEFIKKQRTRRVAFGVMFVLLALGLFGGFRMLIRPTIDINKIETAIANQGDVEGSVMATGIILPEFEEVISSPVTSRIVKIYHNVGELVKKDDIILSLDKSNDELQLSKMTEELASRENQKKRLELNVEATIIDLQTNFEIQQLKGASLKTKFENEKYLKTLGGTTEETVKQAELEAKIAQLETDHLQKNILNKKAQLQTELKEQEFNISIYRKDVNEVETRLSASDVKVPGAGVITWINDKIGSTVVNGSELIKLSNFGSFKIEGTISEIYLKKISVGSKVLVMVNDSILIGRVSSINPTVQNDAVKFTLIPNVKNHPALSSNKKVDLMIVTSLKRNVIRLPKSALDNIGSSPYFFVVKGDKAIRRLIKLGESNFDYVEVESGLEPGDKVITSAMEDYKHLENVKIK